MSQRSNFVQNLEVFVNNFLKEDLKQLERHIVNYNAEILEFVQLKNTVQTLRDNLSEGFKTQMNIGGNVFMEAKVDQPDKMLVDVGKGYYVEFSLEEAQRFAEFKIKVLTKECDVLRDESVKKRADIKLALMCMAEEQEQQLPQQQPQTLNVGPGRH